VDEQADWQQLIQGLRQGDAQAGHEFWKRYGPALQRLAHRHLAAWLQRRVDAEDIVQSACRSFLGHLQAGEYELADEQGLLALLSAITLNKVLMKSRFHRAKRRDVLREEHARAADGSEASFDVAAPDASPDEAAAFAEQFQEFLSGLDGEERRIIDLRLQGQSNSAIAAALHRTDRWVRKLVERMRDRLGRELEEAGS
jgi:RNA polymerase sigma-70 factor (ECF subfamily)